MAGGYNTLDSTETLTIGDDSWEAAGSLPYAVQGIRGISIRNTVLLTGKFSI